jgi:hypothetical protein
VSKITPYEQLMAAKLDQVPVPDIADGIWAGIEMQLDAMGDMPVEPAHKPVAAFKSIGWYSLAGILVVVLLWWYFSHTGTVPKAPVPVKPLPQTHAPLSVDPPPVEDRHSSDKPAKKKEIPTVPAETKKDTAPSFNVPKDSIRVDSQATPAFSKPDPPEVDLYTAPQLPTSGGKKHKGVKGITNDDYKISAGKDSGRRKN